MVLCCVVLYCIVLYCIVSVLYCIVLCCMYVCMYACMHVCMYACMYVYIHYGMSWWGPERKGTLSLRRVQSGLRNEADMSECGGMISSDHLECCTLCNNLPCHLPPSPPKPEDTGRDRLSWSCRSCGVSEGIPGWSREECTGTPAKFHLGRKSCHDRVAVGELNLNYQIHTVSNVVSGLWQFHLSSWTATQTMPARCTSWQSWEHNGGT